MKDVDEREEDDTDVQLSRIGQAQKEQGGAPGPKSVSLDGNDRFLLFRGEMVSRTIIQVREEGEGGGDGQYADTSELSCDGSGF